MTREEALAIVVADLQARTYDDVWEDEYVRLTVEMAHELIQSPAADLGTPQQPQGEADLAVENYVVTGSTGSGEILTVNALLAECEAAAKMIRSASHLAAFVTNQWWHSYHRLRDRRERLMSPRSSTTADKGKGGDDRAS